MTGPPGCGALGWVYALCLGTPRINTVGAELSSKVALALDRAGPIPEARLATPAHAGPGKRAPESRCYRFCRTETNSVSRSRSTSVACQRALNSVT